MPEWWFYGFELSELLNPISVLQSADDTMLFLRRSANMSVRVQRCFTIFSLILELKINFHKSSILGLGQDLEYAIQLASDLGCRTTSIPFSYLGILFGEDDSWLQLLESYGGDVQV